MILSTPAKYPLHYRYSLAVALLLAAIIATLVLPTRAQAAPDTASAASNTSIATDSQTEDADNGLTSSALAPTLAMQRQPAPTTLSTTNQKLVSENVKLQRQVDDLQTQVDVLIYESKGQLFVYGAITTLISLALGGFLSWLVFRRRSHW